MKKTGLLLLAAFTLASPHLSPAQTPAFPMTESGLVISRPTQPQQPFTVAGPRGILVGSQDGQFESWILPVKLLSHLTIEANIQGYTVPIEVNPQSANIEVRPDRTILTYAHIGFTLRQIMFSPDNTSATPSTGPIVLFQIDCQHPVDLVFRFTPEMRWMWPKRNDGVPSAEWDHTHNGFYSLHMDYPDLGGAITIPTATPGILAPYQERPQVHPLELHLHYDPTRDGNKFFPLLMAVGTTKETATNESLGRQLQQLNAAIPALYAAHAASYKKLLEESTSIQTPDKALNEAFQWGVVSIEQLKAHVPQASEMGETMKGTGFSPYIPEDKKNGASAPEGNPPPQAPETALVAGYYASADSARPGFGWFFGRDALYTLYAVNGFGDFALTRSELEFLANRQRTDGKIMHEFSQTAADPVVDWKSFPYMYAAADATPLFLMAMRDYYRASGDLAFLQAHKETIEKAWAFETAATSDTDHDGIYDNSQGTGWVESWPANQFGPMPHQEVYLALLDQQASTAYAALQTALGQSEQATAATTRAGKIRTTIEAEYYDKEKGCYAFSRNPDGSLDKATTVYPAIAWWDYNAAAPLAHPETCLQQWASPTIATDWGLRDVATTESFYDGMSYHQGSVWPLFTGWGALAEYRANQPLPAEQMLMQNVDLTWAQDPGAVTELLSGDTFVPFGRSTSHQLWSSAMVLTPTLRGLFGISLDSSTNTITVNPHLPASWNNADVSTISFGKETVSLSYVRESGSLRIFAVTNEGSPAIHLRSDQPGSKLINSKGGKGQDLVIPLPAVELSLGDHALPSPGSRPAHFKLIYQEYNPHKLTLKLQGIADTYANVVLIRNQRVKPDIALSGESARLGDKRFAFPKDFLRVADNDVISKNPKMLTEPIPLRIQFPKGQGWQTLEFTLTW